VSKASCLQDETRLAVGSVQLEIARIGICLQNPGPGREMRLGMFAAPVARIIENDRRRIGAAEWAVIPDIIP